MSTNYYFVPSQLNPLSVYSNIHLGISSGGWRFGLHGYRIPGGFTTVSVGGGLYIKVELPVLKIESWKHVIELISSEGHIENEYGNKISLDEFTSLVEKEQSEPQPYSTALREEQWIDSEGYRFSGYEFS